MAAAGARPHRLCNAILMQQVCVDVVTGRGAVITVSDLFHFSEFSTNTRMRHTATDVFKKNVSMFLFSVVCILFLFLPLRRIHVLWHIFLSLESTMYQRHERQLAFHLYVSGVRHLSMAQCTLTLQPLK